MDPFLTQLAELCRTIRTGAKWVIVPSYSLGHTLGERLVLEDTDWANLRFTTPLDLALQMAAPFLVERGVDYSTRWATITQALVGFASLYGVRSGTPSPDLSDPRR